MSHEAAICCAMSTPGSSGQQLSAFHQEEVVRHHDMFKRLTQEIVIRLHGSIVSTAMSLHFQMTRLLTNMLCSSMPT